MTKKEFLRRVTNGTDDPVQRLLDALHGEDAAYCVIGGLAVNAFAEPVVSLDLDVVVSADRLPGVAERLRAHFAVAEYPNSLNVSSGHSDLRIQIQTDPRYQAFLQRAEVCDVLGYRLAVAAIEDVLQGKIWAALDPTRRPSKRQKDLADIMRLLEVRPELHSLIPEPLRQRMA